MKKIKIIKNYYKKRFKELYKENYPSTSIENIILDIFQDKDLNITKTEMSYYIFKIKIYIV